MRAPPCESNSPVTTSQRRAGKPRTRSYTRHSLAGSPCGLMWEPVSWHLQSNEKDGKNKVGGIIGSKF